MGSFVEVSFIHRRKERRIATSSSQTQREVSPSTVSRRKDTAFPIKVD